MDITIRPATDRDAHACGRICYDGFRTVNESYGFPPTFPSVEVATQRVDGFIRHPLVFGVVAESGGGRIVGFNFLSQRTRSGRSVRSSPIRRRKGTELDGS
jgi:hypothetical protein